MIKFIFTVFILIATALSAGAQQTREELERQRQD